MKPATLIVMAKTPRAGRVKTRLACDVGAGRAAQIFRLSLERTLDVASRGAWRTIAAIDPPADIFAFARLRPHVDVMAQATGDLGARMAAAIDAAPSGPVAVIGADIPGLQTAHIRSAFSALGRCDAVVGPAADGGYWLVGLARRHRAPRLFEGVRWSSETALADTLASLPAEFIVERLDELADIDDAADLRIAPPLLRSKRRR